MIKLANVVAAGAIAVVGCSNGAAADQAGFADPLTVIACRDREDPGAGATLVLDLPRRRLVRAAGSGPTILFDDRDIPVRVTAATVEWETAHNSYSLSHATLELAAAGRVYLCQLAKRQL